MATPRSVPLYLRAVADEAKSLEQFSAAPVATAQKRTRRGVKRSRIRTPNQVGGSVN